MEENTFPSPGIAEDYTDGESWGLLNILVNLQLKCSLIGTHCISQSVCENSSQNLLVLGHPCQGDEWAWGKPVHPFHTLTFPFYSAIFPSHQPVDEIVFSDLLCCTCFLFSH